MSSYYQSLKSEFMPPDTPNYYYYSSPKHTEPIEWRAGIVISAKEFYVNIYKEKGRSSNVAYEDICLKPKLKLTKDIAMGTAEEYIGDINHEKPNLIQSHVTIDDSQRNKNGTSNDNSAVALIARNKERKKYTPAPIDD